MNKYTKGFSPYILVLAITYYVLPMVIKNTGLAMIVLLGVIPMAIVTYSIIYGKNHGFNILYVALVAAMFIPSIFIYYNSSASIYILVYGVLGLIGNYIGSKLRI